MTRVTSRATPLTVASFLALAGAALGGENAFSPVAGWPQVFDGASVDGGLVVNLDADPELEIVQVTATAGVGGQVWAFNLDGSAVPGWPAFISDGVFSAPAFGDIDGDGDGEVVVHSFFYGLSGTVYAFHHDGTPVAGFPQNSGGTLKAPALGDVDGDGDLEIISVGNVSGLGRVSVFDGDGTQLPGWPQSLPTPVGTGAAVGDLDGDGDVEILAASLYELHAFDASGTPIPGFPFSPAAGYYFSYSTPVLADFDGDGDREIAISSSIDVGCCGGFTYVLDHDGSVVPGWPQYTASPVYVPPTVADIDGDGALDIAVGDTILAASPENYVYAWSFDGTPLAGFPSGPRAAINAQILVADIDGDDAMELIFDNNTGGGNLEAINHDGSPVAGWPLPVDGSSFQQSPNVIDANGNGQMDLIGSGNLVAAGDTSVHVWTSSLPYAPARAPVPTYQYNVRRNGVVSQPSACSEDLDGDDAVAVGDLLIVLAAWGGPGGDVTGDGTTDVADLLAVLAAWGDCA